MRIIKLVTLTNRLLLYYHELWTVIEARAKITQAGTRTQNLMIRSHTRYHCATWAFVTIAGACKVHDF